ncbi:MAG: HU family DNA-binding protein [Rickettsia endosymbiont of Argas persicus]
MTITKEKISVKLSSDLGFSKSLCEDIVNAVFSNILEIAKEQKLTLKNFGSFEVKEKNPRPGLNFHTKSKIIIDSKKILSFIPSSKLKALINKNYE